MVKVEVPDFIVAVAAVAGEETRLCIKSIIMTGINIFRLATTATRMLLILAEAILSTFVSITEQDSLTVKWFVR